MSKSMLIIGAGAAGLAAGCYAQMNGFKTKIFEMHNKPRFMYSMATPRLHLRSVFRLDYWKPS